MKQQYTHYTIAEGDGWRGVVKYGNKALTNKWFKDRAMAREHNANVMANHIIERRSYLLGYHLTDFLKED